MTTNTPVSQAELKWLQKDCGLPHIPTPLTYELRLAASGKDADHFGSWGYQWADKPHRLLYEACGEVEALAAQIAAAEQRGRLAERERCAGIASDAARTILSIDKMNLPVSPGPIISRDRAAQCEHIAQAILSAKDRT
jgi:hypothetical protein